MTLNRHRNFGHWEGITSRGTVGPSNGDDSKKKILKFERREGPAAENVGYLENCQKKRKKKERDGRGKEGRSG